MGNKIGYKERDRRAVNNISQGKGFQCAYCGRNISAGDECYCGETPGVDNDGAAAVFTFWVFGAVLLFFMHWITTWGHKELDYFLILPILIIIKQSYTTLSKLIKDTKRMMKKNKNSFMNVIGYTSGKFAFFFYIIMFYFSVSAMLNIIKVLYASDY